MEYFETLGQITATHMDYGRYGLVGAMMTGMGFALKYIADAYKENTKQIVDVLVKAVEEQKVSNKAQSDEFSSSVKQICEQHHLNVVEYKKVDFEKTQNLAQAIYKMEETLQEIKYRNN